MAGGCTGHRRATGILPLAPEEEQELRAAGGFGQVAAARDHILFLACGQVSCCIKK